MLKRNRTFKAILMLIVSVLLITSAVIPSMAAHVEIEADKNAEVLLDGTAEASKDIADGEEFALKVTADEGYFIRKILLETRNEEGDKEETIIPLTSDEVFDGRIVADKDTTVEVCITSDSFSFFDSFLNFDLGIFTKLQSIRTPFLDGFMNFITTLGDEGILFIAIALILLITKKYRKIGFAMLASLAVMLVCNNFVLKEIFARERPFNLYETFPEKFSEWNEALGKYVYPDITKMPHSYSFPSGHTSSAFAAGVAILCYNRKSGIPMTLFAFLMGFTRIYVGVHYTTDVIAGALVGIIYALIGVLLTKYLFPVFEKVLNKVLDKFKKKAVADE